MELVYLWIDKFREFSDAGFNFSNYIKFEYDKNNNSISSENVNIQLPITFFDKQILSVTGIVGKNGTGKSNILELICMLLKGAKSSTSEDFLLITKEEGQFKCYYTFESKDTPISIPLVGFIKYTGNLNNLYVMFFSNVFDEREHSFDKDIIDVSVNNKYKVINRREVSDFYKQIRFISSSLFKNTGIEIPNEIQIISKIWNSKYTKKRLKIIYKDFFNDMQEFHNFIKKRTDKIIAKNRFILLRQYSSCQNILFSLSEDNNKNIIEPIRDIIHKDKYSIKKTEEIVESFIEKTEEILNNLDSKEKYKKLYEEIEFIKNLKNEMTDININYMQEGKRKRIIGYYSFSNNQKSLKFINKYIQFFTDKQLFELNWLGISSGHKAYLNMFASISYGLRYKQPNKNLLLCIDEGDLYLHPKWQMEFFEKLLTVLPKIFKGNIQLILTSHSPFLIANLPKQCLIVLDTNKNTPIQNGLDFELDTFGGNIYDLYEKQFFLGNSITSTFAEKKINKALFDIEQKKLTEERRKEIENLVELIGDRVIQYHLKKKLNND